MAEREPVDATETAHQREVLAWIDSGAPLWRTAKPATPPEHLVAYAALVDPDAEAILLVDHRDARRWLPTGGHVEPREHPAVAAARELAEELRVDPEPLAAAAGRPLLVTRTTTGGRTPGHVDVSLWYAFTSHVDAPVVADPGEFVSARWWPWSRVIGGPRSRFDPHLHRFLASLVASVTSHRSTRPRR